MSYYHNSVSHIALFFLMEWERIVLMSDPSLPEWRVRRLLLPEQTACGVDHHYEVLRAGRHHCTTLRLLDALEEIAFRPLQYGCADEAEE